MIQPDLGGILDDSVGLGDDLEVQAWQGVLVRAGTFTGGTSTVYSGPPASSALWRAGSSRSAAYDSVKMLSCPSPWSWTPVEAPTPRKLKRRVAWPAARTTSAARITTGLSMSPP